jgi:flagellar biosynthetic protein FliO
MTMILALSQTPDLGGADGATAALRGIAATVFVLALLLTLAWLVRRGAIALPGRRGPGAVQIETSVPLGERRSLVVVTVDGRRLLLGLTPMQVSLVTELSAAPAAATGAFAASVDRALGPTEPAR